MRLNPPLQLLDKTILFHTSNLILLPSVVFLRFWSVAVLNRNEWQKEQEFFPLLEDNLRDKNLKKYFFLQTSPSTMTAAIGSVFL